MTFLRQNQNIRNFSTTIEFIIENFQSILTSGVRLDVLAILNSKTDLDQKKFDNFVKRLDEIKNRNFFTQFHLYFSRTAGKYVYPDWIMSSVTAWYRIYDTMFSLMQLYNLKQLYFYQTSQITDLKDALSYLSQLNYVQVVQDKIDNILPFIQNLPNLKLLKINNNFKWKIFR